MRVFLWLDRKVRLSFSVEINREGLEVLAFFHFDSIDELRLSDKYMVIVIEKIERADPILKSIFPWALINLSSGPNHFSESLSKIVPELPIVNVAISPSVLTLSISPVVIILALILVMRSDIFPKTSTFLQPINKLTNVVILVSPEVLTIATDFVKSESALVHIPIQVFEASVPLFYANVSACLGWVVYISLSKIVLRVVYYFGLR